MHTLSTIILLESHKFVALMIEICRKKSIILDHRPLYKPKGKFKPKEKYYGMNPNLVDHFKP